ncbi:LOW QUALITY PROTEIN: Endonuclease/exonuclease/phosphatase [Parasponia andersonii]|uniref:Endonuclease/exonuclease/phosphatase n=1 Tax=Parasponia andersonii TaxID=3476 RepID=A0A2P5BEM7_PARAD|nr:LOW QUALITY PROTEIN: Endonuclease/exonuclease/phosphatase [Parasponia andersonii]
MTTHVWCVIGNFNTVLSSYKTTGTSYYTFYFEFTSFLSAFSLVDSDTKRAFYTTVGNGARGLVLSCLDMAFCSTGFIDLWSSLSYNTLPRLYSDHYPLFLLGRDVGLSRPQPFRFLNVWVTILDLVFGILFWFLAILLLIFSRNSSFSGLLFALGIERFLEICPPKLTNLLIRLQKFRTGCKLIVF